MKINKILWMEGDELRSLKNVEQVKVDDFFIHVTTSASLFCVNKKDIIKLEYSLEDVKKDKLKQVEKLPFSGDLEPEVIADEERRIREWFSTSHEGISEYNVQRAWFDARYKGILKFKEYVSLWNTVKTEVEK